MNKAVLVLSAALLAPVSAWAQISLTNLTQVYTVNFDTGSATPPGGLVNSGSASWDNADSPVPGWRASVGGTPPLSYSVNNGSGNTAGLYSFGSTASNDRALGMVPTNKGGSNFFGLFFANNTGGSLFGFSVEYTGEHWREGSDGSTLFFQYLVGTPSGNTIDGNDPAWTGVSSLNFTKSVNGNGARDGNLAANRTVFPLTDITGIVIEPGEQLWIRWVQGEGQGVGGRAGLAVDDLRLIPIPEPPTYAVLALGLAAVFFRVRRGKGVTQS